MKRSTVLAFALVWVLSIRINNYGFLDAIWSLSVAILAPIYALLGSGDPGRRLAFTLVGVIPKTERTESNMVACK